MCTLVTDEKEMLLLTFSSSVGTTCLEYFAEQRGYGNDFIGIMFRNSLDEYEDQDLLEELPERHVVLLADPPAAPVEEKLYLSFEELYLYVKEVAPKNFKNHSKMEELLLEVKKGLEV